MSRCYYLTVASSSLNWNGLHQVCPSLTAFVISDTLESSSQSCLPKENITDCYDRPFFELPNQCRKLGCLTHRLHQARPALLPSSEARCSFTSYNNPPSSPSLPSFPPPPCVSPATGLYSSPSFVPIRLFPTRVEVQSRWPSSFCRCRQR